MRPVPPAIGGYEGVGEVYTVGSGVKDLCPGDWVIPSPPSFGTSFKLQLLVFVICLNGQCALQ